VVVAPLLLSRQAREIEIHAGSPERQGCEFGNRMWTTIGNVENARGRRIQGKRDGSCGIARMDLIAEVAAIAENLRDFGPCHRRQKIRQRPRGLLARPVDGRKAQRDHANILLVAE
jgi:hypothetical protein